MSEAAHLEKTGPIRLLENRREHLMRWLKEGEATIAEAEETIRGTKTRGIAMANELIEIEAALNALNDAQQKQTET